MVSEINIAHPFMQRSNNDDNDNNGKANFKKIVRPLMQKQQQQQQQQTMIHSHSQKTFSRYVHKPQLCSQIHKFILTNENMKFEICV